LHGERAAQSVEAEKEDEKAGADLPVIFDVADYRDGQPNHTKNQRHNANDNYYAHRESSSLVQAVVIGFVATGRNVSENDKYRVVFDADPESALGFLILKNPDEFGFGTM
jgi:hypothetical protein